MAKYYCILFDADNTLLNFDAAENKALAETLDNSVARNRQIRIEYFADSGSPARQRALARFGALMVVLLFTLIAVLSARVVWDDFRFGETSPGIGIPQWWYTIWLPVLSTAIAGRALGLFIRRGRQS